MHMEKKEKVTLKSYGASKYATPSLLVPASKLIKKEIKIVSISIVLSPAFINIIC